MINLLDVVKFGITLALDAREQRFDSFHPDMRKKWGIWSEGWQATGEYGDVHFYGIVPAETFEEACIEYFGDDKLFDRKYMTYWACRLFPSKEEARNPD